MDDIALTAMNMSASQLGMQYALSVQKHVMSDMEMQAMGELEMLDAIAPLGDFIDTYA